MMSVVRKALRWACLAALCLPLARTAVGQPSRSAAKPFSFVAFGDMPYHLPAD